MIAYFTDQFELPLPPEHRFPMAKYRLLRERLLAERVIAPDEMRVPDAATDAQILAVHSAAYLHAVKTGTLDKKRARRIGFPWSAELVERSRRSSGATIGAARAALRQGISVNLAGGTHHAFYDMGGGYCVLNDAVIAARAIQTARLARRVLIIDADVHQGDGTAALCRDDETIFTFSIHGANNYPFRKQQSDLDIALPDGTADTAYLAALRAGLDAAIEAADADLAIYLAGADPYEKDKLGRLALSKAGLLARDEWVLEACRAAGLPVAIVMAGGYAADVNEIVEIHAGTVRLAARVQRLYW